MAELVHVATRHRRGFPRGSGSGAQTGVQPNRCILRSPALLHKGVERAKTVNAANGRAGVLVACGFAGRLDRRQTACYNNRRRRFSAKRTVPPHSFPGARRHGPNHSPVCPRPVVGRPRAGGFAAASPNEARRPDRRHRRFDHRGRRIPPRHRRRAGLAVSRKRSSRRSSTSASAARRRKTSRRGSTRTWSGASPPSSR